MKASRIASRNACRVAAAAAAAGSAVLVLSSPAFAHVSVAAEGSAAKGGYAVVDFKVPNERDNASTTKLEVAFPTDHPLASAMPEPINGWTIQVTKAKLAKPIELHGKQISEAVSKITWTAAGDGVKPGFFQKFPVSVGALPEDADELVFKAIQTYSNKEVVRWIEVQADGAEEPDNPAPVLALTAASENGHHGAAANAAEESDDAKAAAKTTAAASDVDGSDTTARVLGVVGIVVGVAGVAYGVLAGRRRTTTEA
ncbi:YcnI family protein [Streptomyces sp. NBC_00199]|uniref:YcnI family copper-binding membrane protein n=1 Tax=Streptomyces sp. NBC_00199 TaxID=2975678 RepID=UPI002253D613|nr:YcnI family protein [Streptomyces sp. NBC_00199]MCX5266125.1 YcnI family protein [Streptomyces sp. NBC_00199]